MLLGFFEIDFVKWAVEIVCKLSFFFCGLCGTMISSAAVSWTLCGLCMFLFVVMSNSYMEYEVPENREGKRYVSYKYDRIDEVNKECSSVLDSASELKPDDNRLFSMKQELSFINGDWIQDSNGSGAPLMPYFNSSEFSDNPSPLNLVSFWLTDIDRKHHYKNSIFVSGLLQIGITVNDLFSYKNDEDSPLFNFGDRMSQLVVRFQGVYTESGEENGERILCLLGNTMLPSRQSGSDPWARMKESGYNLVTPDDQILLVLTFPKRLSLTSRTVAGSMKSLHPESSLKFFDEVHVSSWLAASANYDFTADDLVSKACEAFPFDDGVVSGEIDMYKGVDYCRILEKHNNEALSISPNWKCNGTDDFCSRFGPFVSINATDGSFKNLKIVLQDVLCEKMEKPDKAGLARVSGVFRAVLPSETLYGPVGRRTVLSNMTLFAEGIWKASSGRLCMVACLGFVGGCDSRICLYIPRSFSLTQRNLLLGTLSSIDQTTNSYFPLEFGAPISGGDFWNLDASFLPYYKYSKIDAAGAVLERDEPFSFGTAIKKSLLTFPKQESDQQIQSPNAFSSLFEDLTLHLSAVLLHPYPVTYSRKTSVEMEILSLGSIIRSYQHLSNEKENPYHETTTEKQILVNVSCQLKLYGELYENFSRLAVEGIYDPTSGKMYLIGCRDVRASWKILSESMDLESGMDCQLELIISYPPTTSRWLINPTARISVTSKRNEDDPLYFAPVNIQTFPIMYMKQREDILSQQGVEGILRISTLSLAIAWISSQLMYIRENGDSTPYISLVMLGVQALGYSLPLITGAEEFFKKGETEFYENQSNALKQSLWIRVIDYMVKLLVLVAFSLTLRLCQKVWRSRVRMLTRTPLEPHRVPSDRKVFLITLIIHIIGYIVVITAHYALTSKKPLENSEFLDSQGSSFTIPEWEIVFKEYLGLVQDFFLVPQVLGNFLWEINCKPLRKSYYIGMTMIKLLPHVYDYVRSPIPNPYYSDQYLFLNPRVDFYSKFGDVGIAMLAIMLAVAVYVQQKWKYAKLRQKLVLGQAKLLPLGSKVYERLPSMSFEAELVSDVNQNCDPGKERGDD